MRRGRTLSALLGLALGGAGLVGAACALDKDGLGSIDAGEQESGADAQPSDATSDTSSVNDAGVDVVSEAMGLCPTACTMEGGLCEGEGGAQCSVYCTTENPCQSVKCPPGLPCYADCTGPGACSGGVDCADASSCTIVCGGGSSCGPIMCGGTDCTVFCEVPGACGSTIDCNATDSCTVKCIAANACGGAIHSGAQSTDVTCPQQGTCAQNITCGGTACMVDCSGSGSCAGGECCDAATCSPRATQNCP